MSDQSLVKPVSLFSILRLMALPLAIFALFAVVSALQPAMASPANVANILKQSSLFFFVACAQLIVIITRGFDLSVGANISLVSVCASLVMTKLEPGMGSGVAVVAGLVTGLAIGVAVGAVNGFLVAYARINAFVATLATLSIFTGIATTVSGGFPIFNVPEGFGYAFNQATWIFLPAPVMLALLLGLTLHLVLSQTVHGRILYLLGDNASAAYVAGRNVNLHRFMAYVSSGVLASIAGLLMTAQVGSGEPNLGASVVLSSIAAAVIGGASLRGGSGTILAPIFGSLLIVVISVGMNLLQIDGTLQPIVIGCALILGTFFDMLRNARS